VAGFILFRKYKRSQLNKVRDADYVESQETDDLESHLNDLSDKTILGPSKMKFNKSYFNIGDQILHKVL